MLPILRIVSVGGVSLAIVILLLALNPPGDSHRRIARIAPPAHGPLIDRTEHPEWRQLLIQAALRRADELRRLRELPDRPVRATPVKTVPAEATGSADNDSVPAPAMIEPPAAAAPPKPAGQPPTTVATLPAEPNHSQPQDDVTGSVPAAEANSIPVDIGESSSTELPVLPQEETPPAVKIRAKRSHEGRRNSTPSRTRAAKRPARPHRIVSIARADAPPPYNVMEVLYGHAFALPPSQQ